MTDVKDMTTWQMVRWTWDAVRGLRGRIVAICVLGLLRVAASLTFIWLSKVLIDTAVSATSTDSEIWRVAIAMTLCMLAEMALVQVSTYIRSTTLQRLTNHMRQRLYDQLLASEMYASDRHSGDILNRLTLDVNKVCETVTSTIPSIIVLGTQLVAAFVLMVVMSPLLGLCALLITPIGKLIGHIYVKRVRVINREMRNGDSLIHASIQEGLQHRLVVQTLECAPQMSERLSTLQDKVMTSAVSRARLSLFNRTAMRVGLIAGYLIAFIWCVFKLHTGDITFGMMTAFLQLVARIQNPISSLSGSLPALLDTATAIERLNELRITNYELRQGEEELRVTNYELRGTKYEVRITNYELRQGEEEVRNTNYELPVGVRLADVTFGYGDGTLVLEHFSHDFKPGTRTVIMGETGVGKSTLTKLILAVLRPQSGTVEVYDAQGAVPVSAATRRYMTYVPQGNSLLHGTIRDNLLLGDAQADDQAMRRALHTAVADFVYDLPQGLDTPCGELGGGLSEGQCQRIAIARALLRDAPVMILDEFNSSLDHATATTLIERLDASRPDATIIYISHRRDVVDHCSEVLEMKSEE